MTSNKKQSFSTSKDTLRKTFIELFALFVISMAFSACESIIAHPDLTHDFNDKPIETQILVLENSKETPFSTITPEEINPTPIKTIAPDSIEILPPDSEAVIDFDIPDAPANADPKIWREAYINGMQTNGFLKLKTQAGLATFYWDTNLNSLVWEVGDEKFGYNTEFAFTGDIVKDIYNQNWIVRKKLTQEQGAASSIWGYPNLHVKDSSELVLGVECIKRQSGESCALVGQIVGQVKLDLKPYLIDDFSTLTSSEQGVFADSQNLIFDALVVRVPNNQSGLVELKVPITPETLTDLEIMASLATFGGSRIPGSEIIRKSNTGNMIYLHFTTSYDLPEGTSVEYFRKLAITDPEAGKLLGVITAFGMGGMQVDLMVNKFFNSDLSGPFSPNWDGSPQIFLSEKMTEDKITPLPSGILLRN